MTEQEKTELKQLIMQKWAEAGLTADDVEEIVCMRKEAIVGSVASKLKALGSVFGALNTLPSFLGSMGSLAYGTMPAVAFSVPLAAGGLAYLVNKPHSIAHRANQNRQEMLEDAVKDQIYQKYQKYQKKKGLGDV